MWYDICEMYLLLLCCNGLSGFQVCPFRILQICWYILANAKKEFQKCICWNALFTSSSIAARYFIEVSLWNDESSKYARLKFVYGGSDKTFSESCESILSNCSCVKYVFWCKSFFKFNQPSDQGILSFLQKKN